MQADPQDEIGVHKSEVVQDQKWQKQVDSQAYSPKAHKVKKNLKINTSRSRGQLKLLKQICKNNKWTEVFKGGDVMWSGLAIPDEEMDEATEIKVNRIPAMPHLCHKKTMGFILNKFRQYWPHNFGFYPQTYLLPEQEEELAKKIAQGGGLFIAKPSVGCQGDNICLIKKLADIPKIGGSQWVVQPYISKPLLIDNKKFDLRLYVLISSIDPYICYLNQQGLARFCTEDYQQPTKQNLRNPYIHLTNYSLNKNSPNFVSPSEPLGKGSKTCLRVLWQQLSQEGIDVKMLRQRIEQLCQKFLTGMYPFLKYYFHATFPKKKGKCFHVVGIDVLVDNKLNPWLLQANNNPSFNIQHEVNIGGVQKKQLSPVDQYVKNIVVEDTIFLVSKTIQKQKQIEIGTNYFSFKKILDYESQDIQEMKIIEDMLKIFHSQCSIRSKWVLTSSQFTKLANFDGMTNQKILKTDYHLIFIKIMRNKINPNQMEFEDFIEALEYIVKQVVGYSSDTKMLVMRDHVNMLVDQLH